MTQCLNHGFWCEASGCTLSGQQTLPTIADTDRLNAALKKIGPNARAALVLIAERMALGRERYGEDFDRTRDWNKEAQEEFLDGAIYLAIGANKG